MMISAGNGFIFQSEKYSRDNAGSSLDKYILLYKGELAYNRGNSKQFPYGAIYEMKEQRALIPYVYHCFKINEDESTRYYSYYLNSAFKNEQLSKIITSSVRGNGLLNISKSDFFNLNIVVPSIAEQKKIACFLDLIEARIETQIKIIKKYESLIKSIEEKLWKSNDSSYVPIKDFLIEKNEKSTIQDQYPVLSSTVKGLFLQSDYFQREVASSNNIGYKITKLNDIIISPQNLWMGNITYNDKFENGIVSPSYHIYEIRDGYNKQYIATILKSYKAGYFTLTTPSIHP